MSAETTAPQLREVRGPSALGGGWRRFFDLLWLMSVTEFRRTYFGTVLGYLWSLVRPLLLFAVLLFVFTQVFRVGSGRPATTRCCCCSGSSSSPSSRKRRRAPSPRSSPRRGSSARPSSRAW